jgi:hypothetical protein
MTAKSRLRIWRELALCTLADAMTLGAMAADPPTNGVWKYQVPPTPVSGEFNNEDPVGLAAGAHLATDCSINLHADDGKVYCFTIRTSMQFFEDSPQTYLGAARKFFDRDKTSAR